jgi:hypothetical protein
MSISYQWARHIQFPFIHLLLVLKLQWGALLQIIYEEKEDYKLEKVGERRWWHL